MDGSSKLSAGAMVYLIVAEFLVPMINAFLAHLGENAPRLPIATEASFS